MTSEVSPARRALTAVSVAVALFAAVVIQLTVVNRLPLPGATGPDLVLLLVAAIAVFTSPATGAVSGFAGGLALDVAPPAAHYAGEYALVFCLAGYAAARVARAVWNTTGERDPITTFTVLAATAAAGEAGKAALGMLLSDPDVTSAAVTRVLPGAVLYDLLLAPLVYWLAARAARGAATWGQAPEHAPVPEFSHAQRLASVFRQASAGAAPNLRLAGTGGNYASPPLARRVPKLRLSGARTGASLRTRAAGPPGAPLSLAGGRAPRLNFAPSRPRGPRRPATRTPGKNWLSPAASSPVRIARRMPSSPSRGWLRPAGSGGRPAGRRVPRSPSRGWLSSAGANGRASGHRGRRPRGLAGTMFLAGTVFTGSGRSALAPARARSARSPEEALAARSAPSGLSALSGAGTPLAGRRVPHAGWLRPSRGTPALRRRRSPRSGWLGSSGRPRTVIGSGVGRRRGPFRRSHGRQQGSLAAQGNWYAGSPSGAWLRRSRHPWRKRLHLPGGRPPVPPGARAMAKGATGPRAREPRRFGLLGGRR